MKFPGHLCRLVLLLGASPVPPSALSAQVDDPLLEGRLLRSAAAEESEGDLDRAEVILFDLMEQRPTSTGGLFALERVLRTQGRVEALLPVARRYQEAEPAAAAPRILMLRVFAELDQADELSGAAEDWLAESGGTPEPYREISRVFQRAFGPERALAVLRDGRTRLGQPSLFPMEVGDLLRDLQRLDEAVTEWSRVIGDDGAQVSAVLRRITEIEEDRAELARPLVEQLARPPTTTARLRAGARIAVEAGLFGEAQHMAARAAEELGGQTRRGFLSTLARQAEEAEGAAELALWTYRALHDAATNAEEARALKHRIADAALAVGDTATALEARRSIAEGLASGSTERRRALAEALRLSIARGEEGSREALDHFRLEFPGATEIDELAVTLAVWLEGEGDEMGARSLLARVEGPRSLLERGYLYLASGEVVPGRMNLREAIPGLAPVDATNVVSLLGLLHELQGDALRVVMQSAVLAHRGRAEEAVDRVGASADGLARTDRAPVLAHGARLAESSDLPVRAAELRSRIVRDHPNSAEAPEAALRLARFRAGSPEGAEEAIRLLEQLILNHPENAVVAVARRELQRLRSGGGA